MGRCPLWGGVRYGEVSDMGRCPLWGGVRYGEVSPMGRCPLWGGCPLLRGLTVVSKVIVVSSTQSDFIV